MRIWKTVPLEELASLRSGVTKGRNLAGMATVDVPYLRVANVKDGHIDLSEVKQISVLPGDVTEYQLKAGDVLMTEGGDPDKLGRGAVWSGEISPCIHQNHIFRVRTHSDRLIPEYFSYFLRSPAAKSYFFKAAKQTTGIASINMTQLRALPVFVPPLPEQKRIAQILDAADTLRVKRRAALAQVEELTQAFFLEMFGDPATNPMGWPWVLLEKTFAVSPKLGTLVPIEADGIVPVVRVGQLGGPTPDYSSCGKVNVGRDEYLRYRLTAGDVLMARAIGSLDHLGKASIVNSNDPDAIFDSHVMRLRFSPDSMLPSFFYTLLLTPGGRSQFLAQASRTAVQFNVSGRSISKMEIPLPPLPLQQKFAARIAAVEKLKAAHRRSLAELDALFAALQHRAFRGEL